jgi:hypothetical protein
METTFNSLYFSFSSKWKNTASSHDAHSTGRRLHLVWGFENFRNEPAGELVEEYWFQPEIFIPILGFASPDWPWLTCKTTYSYTRFVIIIMCATLFPVFIFQASVLTLFLTALWWVNISSKS